MESISLALSFSTGTAQAFEHGFHVKIHQQRALEPKGAVAFRTARARDFTARHLNIVAGPEGCVQPQSAQGRHRGFAHTPEQGRVGNAHPKKFLGADDFPADLTLVEQQAASPVMRRLTSMPWAGSSPAGFPPARTGENPPEPPPD